MCSMVVRHISVRVSVCTAAVTLCILTGCGGSGTSTAPRLARAMPLPVALGLPWRLPAR